MTVPWETIYAPIADGLGQSIDERARPVLKLLKAKNARYDRDGNIVKRGGFTRLSTTIANDSFDTTDYRTCRALESVGVDGEEELLLVANRRLLSYVEATGNWWDRGAVAPCHGDSRRIFHGGRSFGHADLGREGSFILYAAEQRRELVTAPTIEFSLVLQGGTVDGHGTFFAVELGTTTTVTDRLWGPLVCNGTGKLFAFAQRGGSFGTGGPSDLVRYTYDTASPASAPVSSALITSNCYVDDATSSGLTDICRTYDVLGLNDGTYVVAWIDDTSQNIELRRFDAAGIQQATSTITGEFYRVALTEDVTGGRLGVAVVERVVSGEDTFWEVNLYRRVTSTLAADSGKHTYEQINVLNGNYADNIGVGFGVDEAGNDCFSAVWQIRDGTYSVVETHQRAYLPDTSTMRALSAVYGTCPESQPFWYNGRCYSTVWSYRGSEVFGATWLVDWDESAAAEAAGDKQPVMAGLMNVGRAPDGAQAFKEHLQGTCRHVVRMATLGVFRQMTASIGFTVAGLYVTDDRYSASETEWDFNAVPSVSPLCERSALIGGAFVSYYSGEESFELGFAVPPIIRGGTTGSASLPAGTYSYQMLWEMHDTAGVYHRSVPSPAVSVVLSGANTTQYGTASLPLTHRRSEALDCITYRADPGETVLSRVNPSLKGIPNTLTAAVTDQLIDSYT
ncbi:MAG TPA: hypothetical protein ENK57_17200, partial [Polyangiaceae bacterium]|nr:hypothetical protein [Polyangiaceae bacterium]